MGQIASKVNRNVDLFSLLIEGHFDFIALHLQTDKEYQSKREQLLNGFLSIYRLIAANFSSTLSFSPIFDNIMIYSVAIAAISRTLCESIERDAYLLIIALLDERC